MRHFLIFCTSLRLAMIVLVLSVCIIPQAHAGWTSGGGELIGDSHNPWFIQNTETVHYCILIDEQAVGFSEARARYLTMRAINYWRKEFEASIAPTYVVGRIRVASQNFVLDKTCSNNTDISLQFGVVTNEQKKKIPNFRSYAGLSVRTDYDRAKLKGKGFIIIASQNGPDSLTLDGHKLVHKPWQVADGLLAYPILLHEFGHVFGLQHDDSYLMREDFADSLLTDFDKTSDRSLAESLAKFLFEKRDPDFIRFQSSNPIQAEICFSGQSQLDVEHRFFGVLDPASCVTELLNSKMLNVYEKKNGQTMILGTAELSSIPELDVFKDVVKIFLPDEQTVFGRNSVRQMPASIIAAKAITAANFSGSYRSKSGMERKIRVQINPWGTPKISGVLDGEIISDVKIGK